MPVFRPNGSLFGTLCAFDTSPADLSPKDLEIFELMSDLITYELEAEEKSREREEILKTVTAQTESQNRFMSILGHDLRNPLNTIIMAANLQQRPELTAAKKSELAEKIQTAARRMQYLVGDLLDTTQVIRSGNLPVAPKQSKLLDICTSIIDEFRIANPQRKIELYAEDECLGAWDEGRIGQVLSNLISNALNYGRRDAPVKVNLVNNDGKIILQVNNQGNLISDETKQNLFEPFWRGTKNNEAKSNSGGLGLGLYIVKQIVEAHGGTIGVESNREYGSTFTVIFDRGPRDAESDLLVAQSFNRVEPGGFAGGQYAEN